MSNTKKVLSGIALLLLATGCIRELYLYPAGGETGQPVQGDTVTNATVPGLKDVRVSLVAGSDAVEDNQPLALKVRLENGSDQDVKAAILGVNEPGFAEQRFDPKLVPVRKGTSIETATLWLKPTTDHGRYRVTVRYQVIAADQEHVSEVASKVLTIRDTRELRWERFWKRLNNLSKDLTLPLVLAGLGFWFQRKQSQRDAVEKRLADERAVEQKRLADESAAQEKRSADERATQQQAKANEEGRRHQIWQTILPKFYQLAEDHYLPIVRSLRLLEWSRLPDPTLAAPDQIDRVFFEFLFLVMLMNDLRQERGQIFFKSRIGETVVALAWKVVALASERELTRVALDRALPLLSKKTTYLAFTEMLPREPALAELRVSFGQWLKKPAPDSPFDSYMGVLSIMQSVLYFEANRPFDRDWYNTSSDIDKIVRPEKCTYSADSNCQQDVSAIKEALTSYHEEIKAHSDSFKTAP